jgi:hypothetical protein
MHGVTVLFGPPFTSDEAGCTVASQYRVQRLDVHPAQQTHGAPESLFDRLGDSGPLALCESNPFAVVTDGERCGSMLWRLAHMLSVDGAPTGAHSVAHNGAQQAADLVGGPPLLAQAFRDAQRFWCGPSVTAGDVGLAGMDVGTDRCFAD